MLSDLQKKKLTALFNCYDTDRNGYLEQSDYKQVADNLTEAFGLLPKRDAFRAMLDIFWGDVQKQADLDGDGRVSHAEYLQSHEILLTHHKADFLENIQFASLTLVKLMDANNDGQVSKSEYTTALSAFNVNETAAQQAFAKLDRDQSGHLTLDEMIEIVQDFYLSSDPQAVGNWMVGPH